MKTIKKLIIISAVLLFGCTNSVPLRTTESACRISPAADNCGLCVSRPSCSWCATINIEERGCFSMREVQCMSGAIIQFSDYCDSFSDSEVFNEKM